jgi:ribonuclease G
MDARRRSRSSEDDQVAEFYSLSEAMRIKALSGTFTRARSLKVLPGMQSAFVDIGLERDSFLYVSDFLDEEDTRRRR